VSESAQYPIYKVAVRWEQDGEHDPSSPAWHGGLPAGRIWNFTRFERMYRDDPGGVKEVERVVLKEWWPEYVVNKLSDKAPCNPQITVTGPRLESWCLSWFEHWTFDVGQSNEQAIESFEAFVRRYERKQGRNFFDDPNYHCLMGAEDRWRWRGVGDNSAPCRCDDCKAHRVIRIGH